MNNEKMWGKFIATGRISDYLEYKATEEDCALKPVQQICSEAAIKNGDGESSGNGNAEGNSAKGISRR